MRKLIVSTAAALLALGGVAQAQDTGAVVGTGAAVVGTTASAVIGNVSTLGSSNPVSFAPGLGMAIGWVYNVLVHPVIMCERNRAACQTSRVASGADIQAQNLKLAGIDPTKARYLAVVGNPAAERQAQLVAEYNATKGGAMVMVAQKQ